MLSIHGINASAAASYYEKTGEYYADQSPPSRWLGGGAARLGLDGQVEIDQFRSLLEGKLPNGIQLGTQRDGEWKHRPGWDLTFSAPKSVSMLAEVASDARLIEAHEAAVREALAYIEQEAARTRIKEHGEIRTEATDNLLVASVRHDTSRQLDPDTHTHCVVLNATQSDDGQWRSIESRDIYRIKMSAGLRYRQELAFRVREAGYQIQDSKAGNAWSFEIAGVGKDAIKLFSSRSGEIDAALAERGLTREIASAKEKEIAALHSRKAKVLDVDPSKLREQWRENAARLGLDVDRLRATADKRTARSEFHREIREESKASASQSVNWAIAHLSERDAQFRRDELVQVSFQRAESKASIPDIRAAIDRRIEAGELLARPNGRVTTRDGIEIERNMLALEKAGRGMVQPLATLSVSDSTQGIRSLDKARIIVANAESASAKLGHSWTHDQRQATIGLLTDRNRIVGIQGAAGTAKTSSVIKTVAQEFERSGIRVVGMSPTNSAANQLRDGGGISDSKSLAKHMAVLKSEQREIAKLQASGKSREADQRAAALKGQAWIVDESSMVSSRQMHDLLKAANQHDARVILVGDTQQLASVGAGQAFAQLQEGSMRTYRLNEIVRQRDPCLRDAVMDSYRGAPAMALDKVRSLGGIVEINNPTHADGKGIDREAGRQARAQAIAGEYSRLTAQERAKSLIIAPGNDDRQLINQAVRSNLRERGELDSNELKTNVLQPLSLTEAEKRHAGSYQTGHVVRFNSSPGKALREQGIEKGSYATVTSRDGDKLTLSLPDGRSVNWNPSSRGSGAGKTETFEQADRAFSAGDRIQLTRNDSERGLTSRSAGTIQKIDGSRLSLTLASGKSVDLDMSRSADKHLEYGYAVTAHSAQGLTAERVFVHAESHRSHLVNMRSLYVGLSRAQDQIRVYTDSFSSLRDAVQERGGEKLAAMDERLKNDPVRSIETHSSGERNASGMER